MTIRKKEVKNIIYNYNNLQQQYYYKKANT